jgi:thiol-disulfide isomerase/thioredoxin
MLLKNSRFWLLAMGLFSLPALAMDIRLPDRTEVPVQVHAAEGSLLLLWLPSGFNSQRSESPVAEQLARSGIEVWQADVLEGRFLIPAESSLEAVPDSDIVGLIDAARQTRKRVVLVASARAGLLALRGVQRWLAANPKQSDAVAGVILLHPNLYVGPPEPGREAEYHPVVAQTRVPVFILQPEQSPWRWRLNATRAELERSGAAVYSRLLTDVRDRFYFRPDAREGEVEATRRLAVMLRDAARLLALTPLAPPSSVARAEKKPAGKPGIRGLQPYRGNPVPPPIDLADLDGTPRRLSELRGRVVLVNFWASWCPPCVHEMPSMQRLREKLKGQPFEILAVNMGENDHEVREFLANKVKVNFPMAMDRDGSVLRQWRVFVFPTSYVIDPEGRIRLGAFGELEWDSPEVIGQIRNLLPGAILP